MKGAVDVLLYCFDLVSSFLLSKICSYRFHPRVVAVGQH